MEDGIKMYNNNDFIDKANNVHNNFYNYSLVNYVNSKSKVKIICPEHGVFEQTPSKHLSGRGCQICGGSLKKSNGVFIYESMKVHNDFYDYSLVDYKNMKTKVKIICPVHGVFEQKPESHLKGHGCIKCMADENKKTKKDFIERAINIHGDKYDYDKVVYIRNNIKVIITCKVHGDFDQNPSNHLSGQGCPYCKIENSKLTKCDFIRRSKIIHQNYYDYSLVEYINNYTKVKINCPEHGVFEQIPNFHLLGQGCPSCKKSIMENKISCILNEMNITHYRQKIFKNCKNITYLPFDFFIPYKNIVIEYNGKQHYEPIDWFGGEETLRYIQNNDEIKKNYCLKNNINYIEISYKDDKKIKEILNGIFF